MQRIERFDPVAYLSTSNESSEDKVLEMAYHINSVKPEELPETSEVAATIDQELVDLDNMYRSMNELDERLKTIAHEGVIKPDIIADIEKQYPGTIVTDSTGVEGRGTGNVDFKASVESLKVLRLGMLIGALIAAIGILMKWASKKVVDFRNKRNNATEQLANLGNLLRHRDIDIVNIFKAGSSDEPGNNKEKAVVDCIRGLLGNDVTLETVQRVFSGNTVTFARLLTECDERTRARMNSDVLTEPNGLDMVREDIALLRGHRNDLLNFNSDCYKFANDIPRWFTAMKDGYGVGHDSRTLSPETPVNDINLDVIIAMSKKLGIALNQPTGDAEVSQNHRYITLNKASLGERLKKYKGDANKPEPSATQLSHLNNPGDIFKLLTEHSLALHSWRRIIKADSSKLGSMSKRLSVIKKQLDNMPRDSHAKIAELEALSDMVVSNFSSMSRYVVTVDTFNEVTNKTIDNISKNIALMNNYLDTFKTI